MSKRQFEDANNDRIVSAKTEEQSQPLSAHKNISSELDVDQNSDNHEELSDEIESDGEIIEVDDDDIDNEEVDDETFAERKKIQAQEAIKRDQSSHKNKEIYLPHLSRPLGPDEVLEADPTVYDMLHNVHMPWPCLTLDILPDQLGSERRTYPQSLLMTTATQAARKKENELMVLSFTNLHKTLVKDDDDDDDVDEDDEDDDTDPIMENENLPLRDTTNRLKVSPLANSQSEALVSVMSENGEVYIFDLAAQMKSFTSPGYQIPKPAKKPIHTIRNHGNVEGYAVDWSPLLKNGGLLTGDCSGRIYFTQRHTSKWVTDKQPFSVDNNLSVEDIQWSRTENTVFASAGCDGYLRIWDTRSKKHKPAISVKASNTDINVLSWNHKIGYLLASGDDSGSWGVWDLRNFSPSNESSQPVAQYNFHNGAITAIQFNPLEESIVAVASEDNTVTLWDLSVEADDEEIKQQETEAKELANIPPQLLFVHWQKEVKDVKWHPQIPGCLVSTGTDGLNIWKTISV